MLKIFKKTNSEVKETTLGKVPTIFYERVGEVDMDNQSFIDAAKEIASIVPKDEEVQIFDIESDEFSIDSNPDFFFRSYIYK